MIHLSWPDARRAVTAGSGYTLIELSVVVFLIALMLSLSVPRIRDTLFADNLKAATRRLAGASRELKNEAIREHVDYILHLDISAPGFWTYSADTTAEKLAEIRKRAVRFADGVTISGFIRPGQEKINEGDVEIRFHREGYIEPAVVYLTEGERSFTIVFHPFLDRVTVYEKEVPFTFDERQNAPKI